MGMGFAPSWLRQVSPPASQNHFNHCVYGRKWQMLFGRPLVYITKRSWSWSWDAKSWSWSWSWKKSLDYITAI